MIFTTPQTSAQQVARLRERGAQVFVLGEQRVDLVSALNTLKRSGVQRLLVEGGGTLNLELLKQNLVDELYIYVAPLIFGGASAPTLAGGVGLTREQALPLQLIRAEDFGAGGVLLHYRANPGKEN
jgi:2,5-diamino-6-(ribosylamino)-4(3H)-pyrimidinone 5'-phosphate reductase